VLIFVCAWKGDGSQIDLFIDRRDQTIDLCEMKFSQGEFEITKQYDAHLLERAESFRSATKTRKALHQTFVTT
ncbi:ATP-binding protein, partial [Alistipes putredinis]|nr:ATP-binding protein [Alistipes putredinis]